MRFRVSLPVAGRALRWCPPCPLLVGSGTARTGAPGAGGSSAGGHTEHGHTQKSLQSRKFSEIPNPASPHFMKNVNAKVCVSCIVVCPEMWHLSCLLLAEDVLQ